MNEQNAKNGSAMLRLATFIVDKRNLVFLLIVLSLIFSAFSQSWVKVENDLAEYLPPESKTRQALDIMEEEFTTFGTAKLLFANISLEEAVRLNEEISAMPGVQGVEFDESAEHYNNVSALYDVTFDHDEKDDRCLELLDALQDTYSDYDLFVSTSLGDTTAEMLAAEVNVIMVYVAVVVCLVLLITSQTYAEIPVLLLTFVTAMILNSGTNFLLGTISFVSNSVTSILQLALSLDYAVILCNRFKEEHQTLPVREAAIEALSKAIPEISSSSLTTVGGLVAMMFMKFRIGPDMGICLIKAILYALFAVFVLMPGLLVLFGPAMDKTRHRNFVPKIPFVGRFAYATRKIVPLGFVVLVVAAYGLSKTCPYVYGLGEIETPKLNQVQITEQMIEESFGTKNMVALVVPAGDYKKEAALLADLEKLPEVNSTKGLSNVEAQDGYKLTDRLTPRQFSELADLDYEAAQLVYAAYAADREEYGNIVGGIESYDVPLIDIYLFVVDQVDAGYVSMSEEEIDELHKNAEDMRNGRVQLQGENYSRMLVFLDLPVSGEETYAFLDTMEQMAQRYYPGQKVYAVGDSSSEYDFKKSFARDNLVVSIMSILIVLVVLLFTFNSAGMPLLLILVIQGSIWVNFSFPGLMHKPIFFLSYLVVSSIQMGANIDYAIVISSRFMELRNEMDERTAIIETMNFAFPTIIISGSILAISGILIGQMTSNGSIVGIGQSLGRGTILSVLLVMFVLPQILLLGSGVIERTSFSTPKMVRHREARGRIRVDGRVLGEVHGTINGILHATVEGDVDLKMIAGEIRQESEAEQDEE